MQDREFHLLVTPHQNKSLPVYRWYNYNHSFSRGLVIEMINKFALGFKDKILDPFCGTGTTLLASKEKGIPCIGIDILPLSVFVSNAKVSKYEANCIEGSLHEVKNLLRLPNHRLIANTREGSLARFFPSKALSHIILVREWCRRQRSKQLRYFYLTALLSVLEKASYVSKDGGFLRMLPRKNPLSFRNLLLTRLDSMLKDLTFFDSLPSTYSHAFEGDARQMKFEDETFSTIITSPPYLNRHDYTRVYMLELLTAFIDSQDSLKSLRYRTLRSHVEARKVFESNGYFPPRALIQVLDELKRRSLPNKQVIKMIEGYFEDMFLVLKECKRVVRKKGRIVFVIGDVRYGGIKVPVNDILIAIGGKVNLGIKEKIVARIKGNSPQQMGKYGKDPVEECILVWERK